MSLTPIVFTVRDAYHQPIPLALLLAVSPNGNWQAMTDDNGQFIANLAPGHYDVTATKEGYQALTVSTDIGAVSITLQSNQQTGDAIDLSQAVIVNSPDVRAWTPTAKITRVQIVPGGNAGNTIVSFTKNTGPDCWPNVTPPGWEGPLQYTVWLFLLIDQRWTGAGFIQCWQDRDGCGDSISDYPVNWYYPSAWNPMTGHVIQPGETIAYMVTAGSARGGSEAFSVAERSNVVTIKAPVGDSGTFTW